MWKGLILGTVIFEERLVNAEVSSRINRSLKAFLQDILQFNPVALEIVSNDMKSLNSDGPPDNKPRFSTALQSLNYPLFMDLPIYFHVSMTSDVVKALGTDNNQKDLQGKRLFVP